MLEEIAHAGWMVNNLFQLNSGEWRCNLRRKTTPRTPGEPSTWAHEFSDAATPKEAVAGAMVDMRKPRNNERVRGFVTKQKPTTVDQAIEDSGL